MPAQPSRFLNKDALWSYEDNMKLLIPAGSTSWIDEIFIQNSSVTTGAGLTGLVFNSAGLTWYYKRQGSATWTQVTIVTASLGTYTSGGFVESDATHAPGMYEIGIPNAVLAAGAGVHSVLMYLQGAVNMAPVPIQIEFIGQANELVYNGANTGPLSISGGVTFSNSGGDALALTASGGNGNGLNLTANGTGAGLLATGGATGAGISGVGGATSGDGIKGAATTSGHGMNLAGVGTTKHGLNAAGGATTSDGIRGTGGGAGHGINAQSGSGATGNGINAKSNATNGNGMALALAGTGKNLDATTENEISSNLADTVNTGATHNIANSIGKQIRQAAGGQTTTLLSGTAQAGSTSTTIKLSSSASATNSIYVGATVVLTGGTGVGQSRRIVAYNGSTKVATVDRVWVTTPDNTTTFDVDASPNALVSDEGVAQAGGASTITLASTASASDSLYVGAFVTILSGTGAGQTREISAYVGATRVATVSSVWTTPPDSTSAYAVIPSGNTSGPVIVNAPTAGQIAAAILSNPSNLLVTNSSGYVTTTYAIAKNATLSAFTFIMLDSTTGTPKTGLTVTAQRTLDGGALASMANAVAEIGNGLYKIDLAAADTNGNAGAYRFTAAGALDTLIPFVTQS